MWPRQGKIQRKSKKDGKKHLQNSKLLWAKKQNNAFQWSPGRGQNKLANTSDICRFTMFPPKRGISYWLPLNFYRVFTVGVHRHLLNKGNTLISTTSYSNLLISLVWQKWTKTAGFGTICVFAWSVSLLRTICYNCRYGGWILFGFIFFK